MKNWLIGQMGTPGEYMYGTIHVISVAVILLGLIVSVVFCRIFRKDQVKCRRLLVLGLLSFLCGRSLCLHWLRNRKKRKAKA